jgi:hypothetical protein
MDMATHNRLAARACAGERSVSHAGDATAFVKTGPNATLHA